MSGFAGEVSGWGLRFWDPNINVGQAVQQGGQDRVFPSREAALQHIDSMPPSDTDYAVIDRGNGTFTVNPITDDFDPGVPSSVRLTTDGASYGSEAVAVVFRDSEGAGGGRIRETKQTITADGAGPTMERSSETQFGRGLRALQNIGDSERGGTLGSGSDQGTWQIASQ